MPSILDDVRYIPPTTWQPRRPPTVPDEVWPHYFSPLRFITDSIPGGWETGHWRVRMRFEFSCSCLFEVYNLEMGRMDPENQGLEKGVPFNPGNVGSPRKLCMVCIRLRSTLIAVLLGSGCYSYKSYIYNLYNLIGACTPSCFLFLLTTECTHLIDVALDLCCFPFLWLLQVCLHVFFKMYFSSTCFIRLSFPRSGRSLRGQSSHKPCKGTTTESSVEPHVTGPLDQRIGATQSKDCGSEDSQGRVGVPDVQLYGFCLMFGVW